MLDWVEQPGIESRESRQVLGVEPVVLVASGMDESELSRVSHQHLVAASFELAAHPWRMRTRLDGYAHRFATGEPTLEAGRGSRDAALLDDLAAVGVEETQVAVAIAEVDAHGDVELGRHGLVLLMRESTSRSHDTLDTTSTRD